MKKLLNINQITKHPDFVKIFILRAIGNFLVLFSIFIIVKTFYNPFIEEIKYFWRTRLNRTYILSNDATNPSVKKKLQSLKGRKTLIDQILRANTIEIIKPVNSQFSIVIPKIDANAAIIANVNPADKKEYLNALKKGVAHSLGSTFPGEGGHIFLFAHSTDTIWNVGRYNAIFYLLYKLEKGDEINIFYLGKRHKYIVDSKKVVKPNEVEYLTKKTDSETLTLQTCWPPGTVFQRLLVFARPAKQ